MLTFFSIFALQMKIFTTINCQFKRKLVTAVFITASLAAFATLGDGSKDGTKKASQKTLLSARVYPNSFKTFSLKSGYNYRGNNILSTPVQNKFITLNTTVVTYEKGNTTYILPLKKRILLDKVKFNPAR